MSIALPPTRREANADTLTNTTITIPAGTDLMGALKLFSQAKGDTIFAAPSPKANLSNAFPPGSYKTDSFLLAVQQQLGDEGMNFSGKTVTFVLTALPTPTSVDVGPYYATQLSNLDELNNLLSSYSASDLQQWEKGAFATPVVHFPVTEQNALMTIASRLGGANIVNGKPVTDLAKDPSNFEVELDIGIQLFLTTPDGTTRTAQLSFTPGSMRNLHVYQISGVALQTNSTALASPQVQPANQTASIDSMVVGRQFNYSSNGASISSLGDIANALERQIGQAFIVDKRLSQNQFLIVGASNSINADALLDNIAVATGFSWRKVKSAVFLAEKSEGINGLAVKEISTKAAALNQKLLSFVIENIPEYVTGLTKDEFLNPNRPWSSLTDQERSILLQIVPQSIAYSDDGSKIALLLNDKQNLSDTTISYNVSVLVQLECQGAAFGQCYDLLPY